MIKTTRALRTVAVSTLLIAGCLLGLGPRHAPASAHAGGEPIDVGVQTHVLWGNQTDQERRDTLDADAALGAGWVRIDFGWCSLEEAGSGQVSNWYLDRADRMVNHARDRGLQVLMTFWCTPGWANGNQGRNVPPTDVYEYARAARFAARHFEGRVSAWEIWNEPNLSGFWSTKDPVYYTKMLRASYPAIKSGDPAATVVFGGPSHNDVNFIRAAYDAGARGHFDAMATHPYQAIGDEPPERPHHGKWYWFTSVELVRELMVEQGDADLPIWFTEFGWSSHDNDGTEANWQRGVSEAQQADYTVRALKHAQTKYPYVTHAFVYNDRAKATTDVHQEGYGLMRRDLSRKPVFDALQAYLDVGESRDVEDPVESVKPTLEVAGYKVKGIHHSDLRWRGIETATVEIHRTDAEPFLVANNGSHTDRITARGSATYAYRVCEPGTSRCSIEVLANL